MVIRLNGRNSRVCPTALSCLSPGISLGAKALAIHTGFSGPRKVLGDKLCMDVALPCKRTSGTVLMGRTSVKASRLKGCLCLIGSSGVIHCQRVRVKRLVNSALQRIAKKLSPRSECIAGTLVGIESKVGVGPVPWARCWSWAVVLYFLDFLSASQCLLPSLPY